MDRDAIAVAFGLVLQGATLIVLAWTLRYLVGYTRATNRLVDKSTEQVEASTKAVDAANRQVDAISQAAQVNLRPVLTVWLESTKDDPDEKHASWWATFGYWNIGSGPALNIIWKLLPAGVGAWNDYPRTVSWGVRDDKGSITASLPVGTPEFTVGAEYEDVFGNHWETRLKLASPRVHDHPYAFQNRDLDVSRLR